MQITADHLAAEAGRMALELRFKDQAITRLEAELAQLRRQLAAHEQADESGAEADAGEPAPPALGDRDSGCSPGSIPKTMPPDTPGAF